MSSRPRRGGRIADGGVHAVRVSCRCRLSAGALHGRGRFGRSRDHYAPLISLDRKVQLIRVRYHLVNYYCGRTRCGGISGHMTRCAVAASVIGHAPIIR